MADLDGRSTVWSKIVYPESLPHDWLDYLRSLHCEGAISPLHCNDVWSSMDEKRNSNHVAGTPKKPHFHVLIKYSSKKSLLQFENDMRYLNSSVPAEAISNYIGMFRYLVHVDDPDKYQYSIDDITPLCGADVKTIFAPTPSQRSDAISQIVTYLMDHQDISEFDVLRYHAYGNPHWIYVLDNMPCYGVIRILNSRRHRLVCAQRLRGTGKD